MDEKERRTGTLVLVVDDDRDGCEMLAEILGAHGYATACAESVSEAILVLESGCVGLVVTDYSMPGEDGLGLLRRMRERAEWTVPAILVSGHDVGGRLGAMARAAGVELLSKPIDLAHLLARIELMLGRATASPADVPTDPSPRGSMGPAVEIVEPNERRRDPRAE